MRRPSLLESLVVATRPGLHALTGLMRCRGGAAAIETALLLPLIVVAGLGSADLGRVLLGEARLARDADAALEASVAALQDGRAIETATGGAPGLFPGFTASNGRTTISRQPSRLGGQVVVEIQRSPVCRQQRLPPCTAQGAVEVEARATGVVDLLLPWSGTGEYPVAVTRRLRVS